MRILNIAALLLLASHPALAAVPNTVAIATEATDVHPKLAAEVQDGLGAEILYGLGEVFSNFARSKVILTQVSDPNTSARILACTDDNCLEDVAKSTGVDLVVQVRLQTKKPAKKGKLEYVLSMQVARDAPSRDSWREKTDCQACAANEIKHMASLLASTIAGQIKIDVPAAAAAPKLPVPVEKPEPPPIVDTPPVEEKPGWYVPRYLSITALLGGAALMGAGGYLLAVHGNGTCDLAGPKELCARRYQTRGLGIGLISGGGLLGLGGLVGLFFGPPSDNQRIAFAFTTTSISIGGTF